MLYFGRESVELIYSRWDITWAFTYLDLQSGCYAMGIVGPKPYRDTIATCFDTWNASSLIFLNRSSICTFSRWTMISLLQESMVYSKKSLFLTFISFDALCLCIYSITSSSLFVSMSIALRSSSNNLRISVFVNVNRAYYSFDWLSYLPRSATLASLVSTLFFRLFSDSLIELSCVRASEAV